MEWHLPFESFREKEKTPPPVGLEPTTFELEVQHASPLRHGGFMPREQGNFLFHVLLNTTLFFLFSVILEACWLLKLKFDIETA